jgi:hypothetical protein
MSSDTFYLRSCRQVELHLQIEFTSVCCLYLSPAPRFALPNPLPVGEGVKQGQGSDLVNALY